MKFKRPVTFFHINQTFKPTAKGFTDKRRHCPKLITGNCARRHKLLGANIMIRLKIAV